jgi:hypothetical protein
MDLTGWSLNSLVLTMVIAIHYVLLNDINSNIKKLHDAIERRGERS